MQALSSPHCHTTYVDGKSSPSEMALAAFDRGFVSMGYSEHGSQYFDKKYGIADELLDSYRREVRALADEYSGRMRIYLGIERDKYSYARREDYDYVLGACHYFFHDGEFVSVDGELGKLLAYRDMRLGGDGTALAIEYFDMVGDYILSYRPDICAHFDLVRIRNANGVLYDADDPRVIKSEKNALEKILDSGALLELNTGGMARSGLARPYPDMRPLKWWHDMGGRVIIGSDCHRASQIDFAYDQMNEYLKAAGYSTAWRLGGEGEEMFAEYPLD